MKSRMPKAYALLCAMLAVSLCAPGLWTEIPAQQQSLVQWLALAVPWPTTVANRGSLRLDHARQFASAGSAFVLVTLRGSASDHRRFVESIEGAPPQSRRTVKAQRGRSPPIAIS
jgi:hypothetical protein